MKICSPQLGLNPKSNLGGEIHDHFVIHNLAKRGHKIFVYLPKGRNYQKNPNIIIKRAPIKHIPAFIFNLLIIPYLFKAYKEEKFDILRVHNPYFVGLGAIVFKFFYPNVPVIATYHLEEKSPIFTLINKLTINRYDKIICVSNYLKNWLMNDYNVESKKISVIYNGVDPNIRPAAKNGNFLKKYNLGGKFTILFMGLLIPRKNPLFLIKVFKQLKKNHRNVSLMICGSGPLKNQIREFIKKNMLTDVHLIDSIYGQEKKEIFNLCDVFALPSLNEGFGLVVAEAMACAKPVVVADNSSLVELVTDGKEGYTLNYNINAWVNKFTSLIKNKDLRLSIGLSASSKVKKQFNWQISTQMYESVLLSLKDENPPQN